MIIYTSPPLGENVQMKSLSLLLELVRKGQQLAYELRLPLHGKPVGVLEVDSQQLQQKGQVIDVSVH